MSLKEAIREAMDFGSFYRAELGDLKPGTNGNYLALCPWHEDNQPSLSVNLQNGLFRCFGCEAKGDVFRFYQRKHGCGFTEALEALAQFAGVEVGEPKKPGLTLEAFAKAKKLDHAFLTKHGVSQANGKGGPYLVFSYRNSKGQIIKEAMRFRFSIAERPKSRTGGRVMVYGLWRLPEFRPGGELILLEGESDTLTAWSYGLPAVGIPGKTMLKTLDPAFFEGFQTIYVWQEPDAPELPGKVAACLPGITVKALVPPPGLKDISEAHIKGEDVPALIEDLKAQTQSITPAPVPAKAEAPAPEPIIGGHNLTDMGNAARLVALHGRDLRYSYKWGSWLVWDGRRWLKDDGDEIERRAKDVARSIYAEASQVDDENLRKAIADHAKRTEGEAKRRAMIASAQCELPVKIADLDRDPWLLNVLNGTLNLKTGELHPHRREDLITKLAPVEYDPQATYPLWWAFLRRIMGDNLDLIIFLQKAVGYALTGSTREQCLFMLYGLGENGKSTFLETIKELLGDYAQDTSTETFMLKKNQTIPNDIAALRGARFVKAVEVEGGRRMAEVLVKQMTGGDTMSARFLHQEWFSFKPNFKIFLGVNHKPVIRGTDWAIWRRIRLIPFTVQIPKEEQDKDLAEKLRGELPGILNWAVEGCLNWQDFGLDPPAEVQAATQEYREEMDLLGDWLKECCIVDPGASALARDLYDSYTKWAEDNGEKRPLSQRAFGGSLRERGFEQTRGTGGLKVWIGIGLKI